MSSRRTFIQSAMAAATVLGGASRVLGMNRKRAADRLDNSTPLRVITPDVQDLSFTIDNGVKEFQLTAEPVKRKIAPWKTIDCWGFNGSCPGPTIQVNEGDRVRLILENLRTADPSLSRAERTVFQRLGTARRAQKATAPPYRVVGRVRFEQRIGGLGRTLLASSQNGFIWACITHIHGLPGIPEWADWFAAELEMHEAIIRTLGIGCNPVLVKGEKHQFLDWISWASRVRPSVFRLKRVRFIGRTWVWKTFYSKAITFERDGLT